MTLAESLDTRSRTVGRCAWWAAWLGLVGGQLHALSRFETADGRSDLELPLTAAWAEPAADVLRPLLDWGDPDLVYVTYGKLWLPVFLAFFLCAVVVRYRRQPRGFEKWAWRVVLVGYAWAVADVALTYWTQWTGSYNALFEPAFLIGLPGVLLTLVGSSVLGVSLMLRGFRPRVPALLLLGTFPLALLITQVTSLGSAVLPVSFAFAVVGLRMSREKSEFTPPRAVASVG